MRRKTGTPKGGKEGGKEREGKRKGKENITQFPNSWLCTPSK